MKHMTEMPVLGARTTERHIAVVAPPVAWLIDPARRHSPWPESVRTDPRLRSLARKRRNIASLLHGAYLSMPDATMGIKEAIETGLIGPATTAILFEKLAQFLSDEDGNERLLLYFPIELMPDPRWRPRSVRLHRAIGAFARACRNAWHRLLKESDLRENFVAGDIPEPEIREGPLPRVVKAVHLAPALVEKGILSLEEVHAAASSAKDTILVRTMRETLPVLVYDRNSPIAREMREIESALQTVDLGFSSLGTNAGRADLFRWAEESSREAERMHMANHPARPMSRIRWEIKRDQERVVERCATALAAAIDAGEVPAGELAASVSAETSPCKVRIVIRALRTSIERIARQDMHQAKIAWSLFEGMMESLRQRDDRMIGAEADTAWWRLSALGVIGADALERNGIRMPQLDGDALDGDPGLSRECEQAAEALIGSPELMRYILPIAISYGSRIKGYAARRADRDIAVFVRPDASIDDRPYIQGLLSEALECSGIEGKPLEFWLDEGDSLAIRDFRAPDRSLGDSTLAHVLFQGVWSGDADAIHDLWHRLLPSYLNPRGKKVLGTPARSIWASEMERDALQYRLMHSGYWRFHPEQKSVGFRDSLRIDSHSAFWDPGYRRLAAILFLKRVFLPDLE